jgi:hypothetical protein
VEFEVFDIFYITWYKHPDNRSRRPQMANHENNADNISSAADKQQRERSSVDFPYGDQDDAVEVGKSIYTNAGTSCSVDQLAAYMKQSVSSSAFRLRLSAARMFGVIEYDRTTIKLTDLGQRLVDSSTEAAARVDSFLAVELYRLVFEGFRGRALPGAAGLESEMARLGVAQKVTDKARQVFERSARQAGFFAHGTDRLVMPAFVVRPNPDKGSDAVESLERPKPQAETVALDPVIAGLVARIPPVGSQWPVQEQVKWLQTVAMAFGLIYGNEDPIQVTIGKQ